MIDKASVWARVGDSENVCTLLVQAGIELIWALSIIGSDVGFSPVSGTRSRSLESGEILTFVKREHIHECS